MTLIRSSLGSVEATSAMSTVTVTAPESVLPALDLKALARRAAVPAALAGAALTAIVVGGGPLQAFGDAFGRAIDADPRWVAGAAAFELLSFAGYVALLWLVGGRATDRLGPARERAGHARRRRGDAPAAHRRRRRRGADALGLPARRPGHRAARRARC